MIGSSFRAGITAIRTRPGLAVLLFTVTAAIGYLLAAPIGGAMNATFGDLASSEEVNLTLLADFFEANSGLVSTLMLLVFLLVPISFLWSAVSGVGLAYAMRDGAARSFWRGVSEFFWRGLGLSLLFLVPILVAAFLISIGGIVLNILWTGEVAIFWIWFVVVPALMLAAFAAIDLSRDYALISLVSEETGIWDAATVGLGFLFSRRGSHRLYLLWFVPALVLILAPSLLDIALGGSFVALALQQLCLLGRASVSVGWIGSEVALFEAVRVEEQPLIA